MNTDNFPKWISIYLWVATAMAAMFSLLAYLKPEVQFATWPALSSAGALSLAGPLGLYISRNLATVAAGAFALMGGGFSAVKTVLVLRAVTDGLDLVHNASAGNMQGAGFAGLMFAIELFALTKMKKAS
jgi:hypothetical protein